MVCILLTYLFNIFHQLIVIKVVMFLCSHTSILRIFLTIKLVYWKFLSLKKYDCTLSSLEFIYFIIIGTISYFLEKVLFSQYINLVELCIPPHAAKEFYSLVTDQMSWTCKLPLSMNNKGVIIQQWLIYYYTRMACWMLLRGCVRYSDTDFSMVFNRANQTILFSKIIWSWWKITKMVWEFSFIVCKTY